MFHYQLLTGSSYPSPILFCVELVWSRRYETLTILLSLCLALVYQLDTSFILGLNDDFSNARNWFRHRTMSL
nr:MAG TPA: glycoside hydrolase family protein [Bacteriophage sp.]